MSNPADPLPTNAAPPLRVLLVDDEPYARLRLRTLLADLATLAVVVGEAGDAGSMRAFLDAHPGRCDLVLLDVQMPGLDGLALASEVAQTPRPPAIVFVTAHAAHAVDAFALDAVDYLTKPVRRERLEAALRRVVARSVPGRAAPGRDASRPGPAAHPEEREALVVSERGRVVRVPLDEVLYLMAELKYVTLRTADRRWLLDDALADLAQRLGPRFLRVHRNALVRREAIAALERRAPKPGERDDDGGGEGWAVRIAPVGDWVAVSRRQLGSVREALMS